MPIDAPILHVPALPPTHSPIALSVQMTYRAHAQTPNTPAVGRLPPAQEATEGHQAACHQQRVDEPHPPNPQTIVARKPHRKSIGTARSVGLLCDRFLLRESDEPTHVGYNDISSRSLHRFNSSCVLFCVFVAKEGKCQKRSSNVS